MKNFLIISTVTITSLINSCHKWCDPENIQNGKSNQHHDTKKFRVMRTKQIGAYCVVRLQNEAKSFNAYSKCGCENYKPGSWIDIP